MFHFLEEATGSGATSWIPTILVLAGFVAFFYFFIIRPQKKQDREAQEMRNSLSIGDEVTTIGGIVGRIISIKGETFVLETTKAGTKLRFLKSAVRTVDVKAEDSEG